ncbi:HesA/MoeB/ThiF family protein [Faucicola atlantae]|uniref:HesA/MoeB/ThiF family protein n=1 Tax=Faucicola atlantae TaxID=34059 RepID=UPI0025AF11E9|nr:HesA/MoeB/ThiF family protein [Moraxella atlantae]
MNSTTKNSLLNQTLSDDELMRYARQILLDEWDIEAQQRLKNSSVLIIGVGGLGCPLAETLARAGVGQITLLDDDTVDISNLQRQSLFLPNDVGQSKALVAQARLQTINEFCQVDAHYTRLNADNAYAILTQFTQNSLSKLICDCTDNFSIRNHLNRLAVKYQLPLLSASAIAQQGQLALYEAYLGTGCYQCVFPETGTQDDTRNCATSGVLASTTQIMANLQAQAALTFLGLNKNPIASQLLLWQGQSMNLRKLRYQQDPQCLVCAQTDRIF